MPPAIPSEKRQHRPQFGVEAELYLDRLNYWLKGVQYRYGLIKKASRKDPGMASDDGFGFWECLAKRQNTDESRARVLQVFRMASECQITELNSVLADYICTPWVRCGKENRLEVRFDAVDLCYEDLHDHQEISRLGRFPAEEVDAVLSVLYFVQAGLLHKLRICEICTEVFIARKSDQATCSTPCSNRRYAITPKERARRAAAQRAKYALQHSSLEFRQKKREIKRRSVG
jgi:hypothetical protein